MGNNKNTILALVVLALFVASGVILYRGFFQSTDEVEVADAINGQEIVNLLPYGTNLNFTRLENRVDTSTTYNYEMVDRSRVGKDVRTIINSGNDTVQGR